jgi:GNAT superfamily N-acetyltransferase
VSVQVRPVSSDDFFAWLELYAGYNTFYELELTDTKALRAWGWLTDATHELRAFLAVDETDTPIGLAHYRGFARPSSGTSGLYLDDLFVAQNARGRGAATALIEAVRERAAAERRSVVRWITAADNETAQRVYDRVATRTDWVTYDLNP